jgi:hypothetical protein
MWEIIFKKALRRKESDEEYRECRSQKRKDRQEKRE